MNQTSQPVIIKKYANRRLYNTDSSSYVTLDDLAQMVRDEQDFVVIDAKTGEDITRTVLTQIIVEQETRGQNLLPVGFLRQLIRFYGNSIEKLVPSFLELSLETLVREQDRFSKQFAGSFGQTAFDALQEQARRNMAMFEQAVSMFTPFSTGAEPPGTGQAAPNGPASATSAPPPNGKGKTKTKKPKANAADDAPSADAATIAELKAQLSAMQTQLDKLAGEK